MREGKISLADMRLPGTIRHVLIAEDSPIIAMELEYSLGDFGVAQVTVAHDVAGAMKAIEAGRIDCALVDVFLGKEDGRLIADRLAALAIPFAFLTGLGDLNGWRERYPGVLVIGKPFSKEDLAAILTRLGQGSAPLTAA